MTENNSINDRVVLLTFLLFTYLDDVVELLDVRLQFAEEIWVWDFYDWEKTSNHAMEQLTALSSSYKTPISLSSVCPLFLLRHYWIRDVSVLLSPSLEEIRNCICDLYRIILSIANQVNVPCLASSVMWLFRRSFSEIINERLTSSIACYSSKDLRADDLRFFMRDFHYKRQFTEPQTRRKEGKTVKSLCNLVIVKTLFTFLFAFCLSIFQFKMLRDLAFPSTPFTIFILRTSNVKPNI